MNGIIEKVKLIFRKINWLIFGTITTLLACRILFYSLVHVSILSIGFFFDAMIDIGVVFLLSFIFKGNLGQKVSFTIMNLAYIVVYIADYMYFKSGINKIASITALYSAGFVDMGAYGIRINFFVILFVLFGLAFLTLTMLYTPNQEKDKKRNKVYLILSLMIFIPYIYAFIVSSISHDSYFKYLVSNTKIFHDLDSSYYMFMEKFGYSVFRYEDIGRSLEAIIQTLGEAG